MKEQDHGHETPDAGRKPAVNVGSGKLEHHCSQCGAVIEGSDEYCQLCAIETSGGEKSADE